MEKTVVTKAQNLDAGAMGRNTKSISKKTESTTDATLNTAYVLA